LDILAPPSSPRIRPASPRIGAGSGKKFSANRAFHFRAIVPGELQVLELVLAHRHRGGPVQQDVGGLQDRVVQEPRRNRLEAGRLVLVLRHPLEVTHRGHRVEEPRELRVLGHVRLHEDHAPLGIEPRGQEAHRQVEDPRREFRGRKLTDECVLVHDAEEALVPVLQLHPLPEGAEIVSEMRLAGRLHSAEHAGEGHEGCRALVRGAGEAVKLAAFPSGCDPSRRLFQPPFALPGRTMPTDPTANRDPRPIAAPEALAVAALEAAEAATAVHLRRLGQVGIGDAEDKGTYDFVTEVDLEAQEAVLTVIRRAFPGHAVLAEEAGDGDDGAPADGTPLWIVDPLDGTTNFLHGHPAFCAAVGVVVDGRPVAGAVVAGLAGERYVGWQGGGAWMAAGGGSGLEPIAVSRVSSLRQALVGTGFPFKRPGEIDRYTVELGACSERARGPPGRRGRARPLPARPGNLRCVLGRDARPVGRGGRARDPGCGGGELVRAGRCPVRRGAGRTASGRKWRRAPGGASSRAPGARLREPV
jgi:fructose-1,6-bisphosphatase/inositol monophosphatase family enzyme